MRFHGCLRAVGQDVWARSFLHHLLVEFIGTTLFLSASLSAILPWSTVDESGGTVYPGGTPEPRPPGPLHVAMAFGLSVSMATLSMGGEVHLNPAVTIAMALTLRLQPWRATLYVMAQLSGSLAGAALVLGLTGDISPTVNQLSPGVQVYQAVLLESLVTFQLVLVVLATTHLISSHPSLSVLASLLVGLAVSLGHLQAVRSTGCGMNPARSFGPAVVTFNYHTHWVFWAGPCAGACLAGLLNDLLLRPRWSCLGDFWAELKEFFPSEQLDTHTHTHTHPETHTHSYTL